MTDRITLTRAGGVLEIVLTRPEAVNALENSMIATICDALDEASSDPSVRAVLVRGEGKAFCAGDDLVDMGTASHPEPDDLRTRYADGYPRIVNKIVELDKPVVCAVQRYALGAGLEIALASDLIVADDAARFGLPFVLRGIASGTTMLARRTSWHVAMRMLATGGMMDAATADSLGLIAQLAPAEEVQEAARNLAQSLAASATSAIGLMKSAMRAGENLSVREAFDLQIDATAASALTHDFAEGKLAFAEKREPRFEGR